MRFCGRAGLGAWHGGAAGGKHGNVDPQKPGCPALRLAEPSPLQDLNCSILPGRGGEGLPCIS